MKRFSAKKIAVAVSGGIDSMALMHLCARAGVNAIALTVDHGLRATSAADALYVAGAAKRLGLRHATLHWTGSKPKTGIEHAAREARYELLAEYCRKHSITVLLTAHQADDQIETFLMHLARGSGAYGLAAIRPVVVREGITIARPLLDVPRTELEKYCATHNIKSVKDEMNEDTDFTRVRIRKNRHLLRDKLGIEDSRILIAIDALGRVRDALEQEIENLISGVIPSDTESDKTIFPAPFLFDRPLEIQLKLLSRLVQKIGNATYPPRLEKIQLALDKLKSDTMFTVGRCTLRRLGDKVLIAPEGTGISFNQKRSKK